MKTCCVKQITDDDDDDDEDAFMYAADCTVFQV